FAGRAVTAPRFVLRDEIERDARIVARKTGVVHSEQTDHFERNASHRFERAKRHVASEKTEAALEVFQRDDEMREDDVELDWLVKFRDRCNLKQRADCELKAQA